MLPKLQPKPPTTPVCDIQRVSPLWPASLSGKLAKLLQQASEQLPVTPTPHPEHIRRFVLCLDDDHAITKLNQQWRNKNTPTNVLAFPSPPTPGLDDHLHLGDIIIAFETAHREARTLAIPLLEHTTHLAIHGLLHLLGYDHQTPAQQSEMEQLEITALATLGFANPYEEPSCPRKKPD